MSEGSAKRTCVEILIEEGDPLGATPDDKLFIVRVQPMTLADGKLFVGDQIIAVNNVKVRDRNHFYQLLRFAPPAAKIEVLRPTIKKDNASEMSAEHQIPPERDNLIDRRSGFDYLLIRVDIVKGKKLGLGIRDASNRVLISKVDPGSIAEEKLMLRDHIIDVEGTRVTDKDVTRELLIRSMRAKGYFTCVIGRPITEDTKRWADADLSFKADPPSVKMNDDVREIAQRQRQKEIELAKLTPQRPPIIATSELKDRPRVSFNDSANNKYDIGNDNKGKSLRSVRK